MSSRADAIDTQQPERIWFLDTLRYWFVLLIVLYHSAQSQANSPLWPVNDPRNMKALALLAMNPSIFVMPILFFIAGYFAPHSLRRKGAWRFVQSKITRLLIPSVFVLVFFNPVHRFIHHVTRGFDGEVPAMGYFEYWRHFLSSWTWFQHGHNATFEFSWFHLWFVTLLFVFFVVTACVDKVLGKRTQRQQSDESTSKPRIAATILGATALAWLGVSLLSAVLPSFEFYMFLSFLDFQVPHIVTYVIYFAIGIVAYKQQWFQQTLQIGPLWLWSGLFVIVTVLGFGVVAMIGKEAMMESPLLGSLGWLIRAVMCVAALAISLKAGQRYFNRHSAIHQHLAANSYRMYLLHIIVLVPIQYALLHWTSLPALVVAIVVSLSAIVGTYLFSVITGILLQRIGLGWMT